jgi:hypothetical protein
MVSLLERQKVYAIPSSSSAKAIPFDAPPAPVSMLFDDTGFKRGFIDFLNPIGITIL